MLKYLKSPAISLNILFFLIIFPQINFISGKSIHIYSDEQQVNITLNLLQGACNLIPCGNTFCSTEGGICENKVCKCKKHYTTPKEDEFYNCCYKQKVGLKAFILEAIFIFGIGHFYVGNNKLGTIKAIVYSILFLSTIIIFIRRFYQKQRFNFDSNIFVKMFKTLCVLACGCTFVIWQMIDSVMFCLGGYTDSKGVNLSYSL